MFYQLQDTPSLSPTVPASIFPITLEVTCQVFPPFHKFLAIMFSLNFRSLAEAAISSITGTSQNDEEISQLVKEAEKQDLSFR